MQRWLGKVVVPNLVPTTSTNYDLFTRLCVVPDLGRIRLDKLTVRDVQTWLGRTWSSRPGTARRSTLGTSSASSRLGAAKAGVPVRVHATRRTCASLLVALDVHPRVAMTILRHSKIAVTMDIYTQVSSASTKEALKRLGNELGQRVL
jgi:integrase